MQYIADKDFASTFIVCITKFTVMYLLKLRECQLNRFVLHYSSQI